MGNQLDTYLKCRTNSKSALAKDIVEGIEKDLEKLRRQQENLQLRKAMALNGGISIVEETPDEREREQATKMLIQKRFLP